jgi:hypothetical protein
MKEEHVAVLLFVLTSVGFIVASAWTNRIPKMFCREQWNLRNAITDKQRSLEGVNSVDTFHLLGKAQRELIKLERQLKDVEAADGQRPLLRRMAPYVTAVVVQCGFVLPAVMLWNHMELVMLPNVFAFGATRWVFFGNVPLSTALMRMPYWAASRLLMDDAAQQPTYAAAGDEWVRSFHVVSWCVMVWISCWYCKRVFS